MNSPTLNSSIFIAIVWSVSVRGSAIYQAELAGMCNRNQEAHSAHLSPDWLMQDTITLLCNIIAYNSTLLMHLFTYVICLLPVDFYENKTLSCLDITESSYLGFMWILASLQLVRLGLSLPLSELPDRVVLQVTLGNLTPKPCSHSPHYPNTTSESHFQG